jgi:hypothetical protein
MYRHDPKRSGSTRAIVDFNVHETWDIEVGGHLTPPVVADNRLFVVRKDAGQIVCLHAETGESIF